MATAIRTIGHEDRLSLVEHLEELRTRLIVSGVVLVVAFGVCLWQNHALLHLINRPLEREQARAGRSRARAPPARRRWRSRRCSKWPRTRRAIVAHPQRARQPTCRQRSARSWRPSSPACERTRRRSRRSPQSEKLDDAGDRRAVHDDAHGRLLLRADRLAAGDPVRAVRLRAARSAAE